jgi:hypothetical protein
MSEIRMPVNELTLERIWPILADLFGVDPLAELVGISPESAQRCLAGERVTSDAVAARLRWTALLVRDLAGSYNEFGIRRWFARPRTQLGGKAPADVLAGEWSPGDSGPRNVRAIATSLLDAAAT